MLMVALLFSPMVPASGAMAAPQSRAELKERFEQRYPDLNRLKSQGKVGETTNGFVDAVIKESELDGEARKLIEDENADRRKLYDAISQKLAKEGKDVSPEKVAERNARRNYMNAKGSEFLKSKDGTWVQRRDVNQLKREGEVGETAEGYVAPVKGDKLNKKAAAAIEVENVARREEYYRKAKDDNLDLDKVAQAAGKKNIENARSGEFIRRGNGEWEKK
jgi:uncharacterized protein YdbL (DUF1318 family)